MTTDRELLELAAKAAGLRVRHVLVNGDFDIGADRERWNPLTDDGDALRLAIKLCMELSIDPRTAWAMADGDLGAGKACEVGDDPFAATRRAIVRAAAEIGRRKE